MAANNNIIQRTFFLIVYTLLFSSCDKIEQPFEKPPADITVDTTIVYDTIFSEPNGTKRYILIEEFTGHTCTNCPDGAREVQRIDSLNGKQVIPVSIHAGYFAKPHLPPDTAYLTDFRTAEGEEYNNFFAVWGNPSAMVSRISFNGNNVMPKADWEAAVNTLINTPLVATVDLLILFNDSLRDLKMKISTKFLTSVSGNYKLQVYLTEDHVIDWQLDGSFNNPGYHHRHVLRKVVNGTWGEEISSTNTNDSSTFEYSLALNQDWKKDDCGIIAFIYETTTYEVIQANEAVLNE